MFKLFKEAKVIILNKSIKNGNKVNFTKIVETIVQKSNVDEILSVKH